MCSSETTGRREGSKMQRESEAKNLMASSDESMNLHSFLGMTAVVCGHPMQQLMQSVKKIARSNVAVLITGETGSGKEVIARAIHHYSLRCARPWVDVNCAALPDHLLESELFGYEKGAFSGADAVKPG